MMSKNGLIISITIAVLTLLFAVASFALYLSKNKSKFWTSKKMKLGAIILSLTAITTAQSCRLGSSCYEPVPENYIYLNENTTSIQLKEKNTLSGAISNRSSTQYSFNIQHDLIDSISQTNDIFADDGKYDESQEEFTIDLDTTLETGNYTLKFYDVKKEDINNDIYPSSQYSLLINN